MQVTRFTGPKIPVIACSAYTVQSHTGPPSGFLKYQLGSILGIPSPRSLFACWQCQSKTPSEPPIVQAGMPISPVRTAFLILLSAGAVICPGDETILTPYFSASSISWLASSVEMVIVLLKCTCLPALMAFMPCSK